MKNELNLELAARSEEVSRLDHAVEGFAKEHQWGTEVTFQVRLILEELVLNIITHGFHGNAGSDGRIHVRIRSHEDQVLIKVADNSWAFNPLDLDDPDLDAAIEDRSIGGLGIHFVRSMMDEVQYARVEGENHVRIVKRRTD